MSVRRINILFLILLSTLLNGVMNVSFSVVAIAAPKVKGYYDVEVTDTTQQEWSRIDPQEASIFSKNSFVVTTVHAFSPDAKVGWKFVLPHSTLSVVSGKILASHSFINQKPQVKIVSRNSSVLNTLVPSDTHTNFPINSGQFEFVAANNSGSSQYFSGEVRLKELILLINDAADPSVLVEEKPDPSEWYSTSTCLPLKALFTDFGSGISRVWLHRSGETQSIVNPNIRLKRGVQPGLAEYQLATCIEPRWFHHGDNNFVLGASDASGRVVETSAFFKVDKKGPVITSNVNAQQEHNSPTIDFNVSDDASGVKTVAAFINNHAVPTDFGTSASGEVKVNVVALPAGTHRVKLVAIDQVGNSSTFESDFTRSADALNDINKTKQLSNDKQLLGTDRNGDRLFLLNYRKAPVITGTRVAIRLRVLTKTMQPAVGRIVKIKSGHRVIAQAKSNRQGHVTMRLKVKTPQAYKIMLGNRVVSHNGLRFVLKQKITSVLNRNRVTKNTHVELKGKLQSPAKNQRVQIEVRIQRAWVPIKRNVKVTKTGSYKVKLRANATGRFLVRVRTTKRPGYQISSTKPIALTVT